MGLMKESVFSLKENTTQNWFSYFQIDWSTKNRLWLTSLKLVLKILAYD